MWTAHGAACVGTPRHAIYSAHDIDCDGVTPPPCGDATLADYPEAAIGSKAPYAEPAW